MVNKTINLQKFIKALYLVMDRIYAKEKKPWGYREFRDTVTMLKDDLV